MALRECWNGKLVVLRAELNPLFVCLNSNVYKYSTKISRKVYIYLKYMLINWIPSWQALKKAPRLGSRAPHDLGNIWEVAYYQISFLRTVAR